MSKEMNAEIFSYVGLDGMQCFHIAKIKCTLR